MADNRIVIFSNGIADCRRSFIVKAGEPLRITIPVRTDHVADVLASLCLHGPVQILDPPTYQPMGDSDSELSLDPEETLDHLARKLQGAHVVVHQAGRIVEGTLVGLHTEPEGPVRERVYPKSLVVLTAVGFTKLPLRELQNLQFTEEVIRQEVNRALERSRQSVRPLSTEITLSVTGTEPEATVIAQYTVPAAAWKISYRLRMQEGQARFQGFAVVDNNTEETWTDCWISVVTGEPITFSTDLAESKTPRRSHVDVVRETALGAVEVQRGMAMMADAGTPDKDEDAERTDRLASIMRLGAPVDSMLTELASPEQQPAEVQDVGDFCIFESGSPVTIPAYRSASIAVFDLGLATAKPILHYRTENHAERPYRAIRFHNETEYSLGRGVCTIYQGGFYAGSCIIPVTKPGDDAVLPHALETGVRVCRLKLPLQSTITRLHLASGFCSKTVHDRQEVTYRIVNVKNEAFDFVLDHQCRFTNSTTKVTIAQEGISPEPLTIKEQLTDGSRLEFSLPAKQMVLVTVLESRDWESSIELLRVNGDQKTPNIQWIERNLVATNGPLAQDTGLRQVLEIHRRLIEKRRESKQATAEIERLTKRQDRLRKNLGTGGLDDQARQWKIELGEAESAIQRIEETQLPQLQREENTIESELRESLLSLSAEWQEEA